MARHAKWVFLALAPLGIASACGGRSNLPYEQPPTDAGSDGDAGSDAPADVVVDVKPDSPPDGPVIQPGLGEPCDGLAGNPDFCADGLMCYLGTDPQDEPERWPGGYCTKNCNGDNDCKAFGGACVGGFQGFGKCQLACSDPTECRQGYACFASDVFGNSTTCAPTGFIATRGPGVACFQHDDSSAPHYAPALTQQHFAASQQMDQSFFTANEIALAVSAQGALVAGANAVQSSGYVNPAWYGPTNAFPTTLGFSPGPQDSSQYYSDPNLVAGKDGRFYYSTLGLDFSLNARLLVASSSDQGKTWSTVQANPQNDCSGKLAGEDGPCMDHPWLAIGPDILDPNQEALYAAYLAVRPNDTPTVLIRSTDGGKTWGIPGAPNTSLAVFSPLTDSLFTNLITPAVDDQGVVHMVASAVVNELKGSVLNSIQYTRSTDGGKTRTPPVRVNPKTEPVPYEQAAIAVDGSDIWVTYVRGATDGAWDIMLARSQDGKTWTYEQVNDEPEACATHFHPAMSVDRTTHKVYVAWYDGRFAPYEGSVAIAVCDPSASGKMCGPNEAVGDQTFFVTTDRYGFTFIGDYFTLSAQPGGVVWAGFGDTRTNFVSHAYLAFGKF